MYRFNLFSIPFLLSGIYLLGLGTLIALKQKTSKVKLICSLTYFSCSIWQLGYFMLNVTLNKPTSLFWAKFAYTGVVFIATTFYHFTVELLNLKRERIFVFLSYLISSFFLIIVLFTDKLVSGLFEFFWGYYTKINPTIHNIFLLIFAITYGKGLINLFNGYRIYITSPIQSTRIGYLLWAYIIAGVAAIDFIPKYGIEFYPFGGPIFVSLAISLIAYAIVKHRLMDIRVVITRTAIFAVVYTLVLGLPFILSTLGKAWLVGFLGANWWLGPLILMAALATLGPFAYIYLLKSAEVILLKEQINYRDTLKQAAIGIARIHHSKELLDYIAHTLAENLHISHSAIYIFDTEKDQFLLRSGHNLKDDQPQTIKRDSALINRLTTQHEPLIYEEIKIKSEDEPDSIFKELEEQMRQLNATIAFGSFLDNRLLYILILGNKLSGRNYTPEDLTNFSVLVSETALAIENALRYETIEEQVRQRTQELAEVQRQLVQAEKMATMGTLAGGVAHEINNPLTAILTNVQMLLADADKLSPDSKESLELIEEATRRCRSIVQKLMTYAKKPLEVTGFLQLDVSDTIKKSVSFLNYQLEQDNIKIIIEKGQDTYLTRGNENELEQVFTNIILNARDAIKKAKKSGDIHIGLSKNKDWIDIKIKDEGVGIPKEIMPRIFDPFFTTKEVGKGLGLGLSICQAIIDKHSGRISIESELNKGTTVTVQLPSVEYPLN
ncbi:MAG: ATP-binding protein [Candidatus Omnitrophica bacterium]|nr:ATP-binding protein [Candidatus Omnitrophota bacterium]